VLSKCEISFFSDEKLFTLAVLQTHKMIWYMDIHIVSANHLVCRQCNFYYRVDTNSLTFNSEMSYVIGQVYSLILISVLVVADW